MKSEQIRWSEKEGWSGYDASQGGSRNLVLVFFDNKICLEPQWYETLKAMYPNAVIAGASSSGSILGTHISDDDAVATAITFERTEVRLAYREVGEGIDQKQLGLELARELTDENLRSVFILSDGLHVNGSVLAKGVAQELPEGVTITGGLAGDGTRFESTSIIANQSARSAIVAAIGFYGESLRAKSGCFAGWEEFAPERKITRSEENVLFEIDGKPALELYKSYLGDLAAELPGSGLRFPMNVRKDEKSTPVIRTLLAVDEEKQSLTFAGDMPQGGICRLMKTNMDLLIDHAGKAAEESRLESEEEFLVLMVSCVGRRLVLGQLCEEELEIIRETLGDKAVMSGFYSYGELSASGESRCSLHNQTMTLVSIYE